FWDQFVSAGGEFRWFNPLHYTRLGYRDHRKILTVDGSVAVVGGFNIAPEYEGDGVERGWRDIGMLLEGDLAKGLAKAFDDMFDRAGFDARRFPLLRRSWSRQSLPVRDTRLFLGGPGLGTNPLKKSLHQDLRNASSVRLAVAYFLPTWGIMRLLVKCARRGGRVQLMLPAKSDVTLSQLASRSLYQKLLRAGVEIYEYEPQILHAKMYVIDSAVYVGSANLDRRSLSINFELLVRVEDARLVEEANRFFDADLARSTRIDRVQWRKTRTFWQKLKEQWALLLLGRIDPFIARRQLESLR
ncbi:MAG TPA: phospholipase D-like domain-containing protein, partial [Roseimicrobium sp.]|nr:phospholipase D-like domain-containing protein [Roseimicrobium sp.]